MHFKKTTVSYTTKCFVSIATILIMNKHDHIESIEHVSENKNNGKKTINDFSIVIEHYIIH